MWMLHFKNLETGKIMWECGFGWHMMRRIEALLNNRYVEVLSVSHMEFNWNSFISCFFGYTGVIDMASIKAEGKVE